MNLENITKQVCQLATETGQFLKNEIRQLKASDIETKSSNNFVTYVDKKSEEMIIEKLSQIIPGSGFIAEENPDLLTSEYTWIIDPLDGTTNFIHGIPLYSISIGLMREKEMIAGVIYEPNLDEIFYTWKDAPSFLNNKVIHVSKTQTLADSLFATGFPYYDYGRLDPYLNFFKYMMKNSHGIRRLGSAAADLAYVACGRYDGFYEYGLSPWDVAAGSIIVKNAGGIVSDFKGTGDSVFGREIIAVNNNVYVEFLEAFQKNFV
ncbi:MAG: inositol monophosphatase family protein [Bacteroidota bacterium]